MSRIMGIDYGTKRVGVAVTDSLQICANGLDTIPTPNIFQFIENYCKEEDVSTFVVGEPLYPDGNPAQIHHLVMGFVNKLKKMFPDKEIHLEDERFTSEDAKKAIRMSGAKKKKRQNKALIDKMSATLILQSYLERKY